MKFAEIFVYFSMHSVRPVTDYTEFLLKTLQITYAHYAVFLVVNTLIAELIRVKTTPRTKVGLINLIKKYIADAVQ